MLTLTLLAACNNAVIKLDDTGGSNPDTDADTDADSDTDTDADSDTDTDTDIPVNFAGDYAGSITGIYVQYGWNGDTYKTKCSGDAEFTVTPDYDLTGYITCDMDRWAYEGDVVGTVADDGTVDATWTVDLGWDTYDYTWAGTIDGDLMALDDYEDFGDYGTFEAHVEAVRN